MGYKNVVMLFIKFEILNIFLLTIFNDRKTIILKFLIITYKLLILNIFKKS